MTKTKTVDGVKVNMTAAEEAAFDAAQAAATTYIQDYENAETAKTANKASGKQKLKTGEALSDAEAEALFGV